MMLSTRDGCWFVTSPIQAGSISPSQIAVNRRMVMESFSLFVRALFSKEEFPPYLPCCRLGGNGRRCARFDRWGAGLRERNDRKVAILNIMPVGACPFLHRGIRACKCHLGL